jgi:hypothetical protein
MMYSRFEATWRASHSQQGKHPCRRDVVAGVPPVRASTVLAGTLDTKGAHRRVNSLGSDSEHKVSTCGEFVLTSTGGGVSRISCHHFLFLPFHSSLSFALFPHSFRGASFVTSSGMRLLMGE